MDEDVIVTIPCIACGAQVRVEAQRCHGCGQALPCNHCGSTHGPEAIGREVLPCFGMHLLERKVIGQTALLRALDLQQKLQEPLGTIALRRRLLSAQQVLHLVNAQRYDRRRFGTLAVEHKWLTEEQVQDLLSEQRDSRPRIGQLLVSIRAIDRAALAQELELYAGKPHKE
jgi:hypothetical protein